jgi:sigma-E factor negative regulatory protein RseB
MKLLIPFLGRLQILGAVLVLLCISSLSLTVAAQDNSLAQELLTRMSKSVRELNYRGKFTFEVADNAIETYELTHRVTQNEENERLVRLNGREKIVVRNSQVTDCLAVGDKILRGSLSNIHPSDQLFSNYSLYLRGEQRIANRLAYLLQFVPHDVYRNGQTLAVDKETFLPLQKQWFSPDSKLIERLQFVEMELEPDVTEDNAAASAKLPTLRVNNSACGNEEPGRATWSVNWLPKGFFLTRVGRTDEGESILSYTDGLASFSIFVREQPVSVMVQGKSDYGATVAYVGNRMWQQNPFRITVIGEIPLLTAQKIVAGLEPVALSE